MDLGKLNAFTVVAEELNFRRSAERLGMSQPPLTRLIASLEDDLGVKLFERTTRKVSLTAAGVLLFKETKSLQASLEKLEADVRAVGKIKRGKLAVGFSHTAFLARLPKILDAFKERLPTVELDLLQMSKNEVIKNLKSGKLDAGFFEGDLEVKELSRDRVSDEIMGVLVPKTHPFSKKKEIEFKDLKNETLILHPKQENVDYFDRVGQLCRTAKIQPQIYIKKKNESCPLLVVTGKGVLLTIASSRQMAFEQTRFVPVKSLFLPVSVYWQAENPSPTLKSFLSLVLENQLLRVQEGVECLADVEVGSYN